jgi:predicted NUDIX family NTP pyrophosphohydrolase
MTAKRSAGILLHRSSNGEPEVFLVHPGGPFWANKDAGAWSLPKGEFEDGEEPAAAALREFEEETGHRVAGDMVPLDPSRQRGGKIVHAWAMPGDVDASDIRSNLFSMEWPPRSGRQREFPEVDRAGWFTLEQARGKINPGQRSLLDQLERLLGIVPASRRVT